MKKKCGHKTAEVLWNTIECTVASYECVACEARGVRSLGPSNDESEAVRVEMRAAELVGVGFEPMTEGERRGYQTHDREAFCPSELEAAGWLAREINRTDYWREQVDATAWPWDPTRPVAGQGPIGLYDLDEHGRFIDQSAEACIARDPELRAIAETAAVASAVLGSTCPNCEGPDDHCHECGAPNDQLCTPGCATLASCSTRPTPAPDALDDEHFDPVDGRFDTTDEILPDEVAK